MMNNGWGMGMGLMWILWPLLILGLVILIVFLVRQSTGMSGTGGGPAASPTGGEGRSRAREILDERYARGEIDEQEYHERLRHLRGDLDG